MPGLKGAPAATSSNRGRQDIFVCGEDDKLYHAWHDEAEGKNAKWHWENVTDTYFVGKVSDKLGASAQSDGRLDIYYTGSDKDLVQIYYDGSKFVGPFLVGKPN